jgi:copper(I)-binding protein
MQRRNLGVLLVVVIVAVVGFVIASGGSNDKSKSHGGKTTTTVTTEKGGKPAKAPAVEVVVKNAKPVGGIQHLTYNKGDQIRLVVKSDVADEIHIHGYDLMKDVKAGGQVEFDFPAKIDGKFEIELESRKQQIADLAVSP